MRGWLNGSQVFTDTNYYDPYGVPDSAINGFGFTGEMTDANGLVYLRARYYDPNIGNFVSLDPFEGVDSRPMSMNGYSWVEGNVANWSDASGRCIALTTSECETCCWEKWRGEEPSSAQFGLESCYNDCVNKIQYYVQNPDAYEEYMRGYPCETENQSSFGRWECSSASRIQSLRDAFLNSASRHNRIPNMDNQAFAALIASLIEGEGRLRFNGLTTQDLENRNLENFVASLGCVVSGNYLRDAYNNGDYGLLLRYLTNSEIPDVAPIYAFASVGIGNIKLPTAASLWTDRACDAFGSCRHIEVDLQIPLNSHMIADPFIGIIPGRLGNATIKKQQSMLIEVY